MVVSPVTANYQLIVEEEHDAIEWFRLVQLAGLRFADPSYLGLRMAAA